METSQMFWKTICKRSELVISSCPYQTSYSRGSKTAPYWHLILRVTRGTEFSVGSAGFPTRNRCIISEC